MNHQNSKGNGLRQGRRGGASGAGITDADLRVEVFALCDGASDQQRRLSLIGAFETIHAPCLPVVLPTMTVALRLRFWPDEALEQEFALVITGPDGGPIGETLSGTMTLGRAMRTARRVTTSSSSCGTRGFRSAAHTVWTSISTTKSRRGCRSMFAARSPALKTRSLSRETLYPRPRPAMTK